MASLFCVLESIDGGGTHAQSELLMAKLSQLGFSATLLRYPDYSSQIGKLIKSYLAGEFELPLECIFLLYTLDQLKDAPKIRSELESGKLVICDRYFTSNLAYQSVRGFGLESGIKLGELLGIPKPDLVILLDLPVELALKRKLGERSKLDRYESNPEFLSQVRMRYLELARAKIWSSEWHVVDGSLSIQQVSQQIWSLVLPKLR